MCQPPVRRPCLPDLACRSRRYVTPSRYSRRLHKHSPSSSSPLPAAAAAAEAASCYSNDAEKRPHHRDPSYSPGGANVTLTTHGIRGSNDYMLYNPRTHSHGSLSVPCKNGISIGSAVSAELSSMCRTQRQTNTQRDHATPSRPHLVHSNAD